MHHQPLPFITLPNWVKAATVCGFNIQPIFDRYAVPTDLIHLEDATITAPQLGLVMDDCVAAARSQHFPFVLGDTFAFDYLPDIGTFLATSPTLRQAMQVFVWVRELINPMIEFRLEEMGDVASLVLVGGNGSPTPQDRYFIESIFAAVAKFGRMLAADIEPFTRLRFRFARPVYADAYAEFFRMPVAFGQRDNALEIPQARLDRPLDGAFPSLHQQAERRVQQRLVQMPPRTTGLVAAIEAAFEQDPRLLQLGIDAVSRRLGLHARTLQRRLGNERQAYAAIRDRVRYRLALRALQNAQADLEAISEQLGFSDRRSFTRAFTRWAGISPSGFRDRKRR